LPPKEATRLRALPKDATISYQASPVRSKRPHVPGFEPETPDGTKRVTEYQSPFPSTASDWLRHAPENRQWPPFAI